MSEVLVVSNDDEVRDLVATASVALGQPAVLCEPGELAGRWVAAATVFVGVDVAAVVAGLGLPRRDRVFLVGRDVAGAALWSMPLGAEVIVLPEGRAWLSSVLAGSRAEGAGRITVVLGGSGGVGASTLAAALAWSAARAGSSAALVDADRLGGGIDLLLGAEQVTGWRWPRFVAAEGVLGDLREFLPVIDGVAVVSMARGPDFDLAREPLSAVLGSLQRSFDHVVIDPGRAVGAAVREAVRLASRSLVVVGGSVRGLAAAGQALRAFEPAAAELVLRQLPPASMPEQVAEDVLGLPVAGRLRHEPRLAAAAERGERPPLVRRRGGLGALCERLLVA
ncbi:septum site-determining protein Ssd [Micropruina sp.]|uniref:septum site-determining protein Ssd n=1 Tax=Micropruina sp. TaxID=2737536 RepID=UPI0039E4872E